jgi:uncharacterized protein
MSFASLLLGRLWKLPRPLVRDVAVEPLRIPMRDGTVLLADRYYSRREPRQPCVLIRTCYGRGVLSGALAALFAERGMQVVIQSCRGTAGSQGVFHPFFDEQADGEDTVAWVEHQPWFDGNLALWGISYLGNTAWAIANSAAAPKLKAMGLHVTLTNFRDRTYAFDGFTLLSCVGWTVLMQGLLGDSSTNPLAALFGRRKTRLLAERAIAALPLRTAGPIIAPGGVSWWQDWMDHAEPGDSCWRPVDYGRAAERIPPTVMVGGWFDIFLPWQLNDFAAARHAGRDVRITIGPWMHAAFPGVGESLRQSIALFQQRFGLTVPPLAAVRPAAPVRLFVMGANEWRDYPSWPIPNIRAQSYFLDSGGSLSPTAPAHASVSAFDYDPAHPTPSLHGPNLEGTNGSGDMSDLERRSDVVLFTTGPLPADLEVIGPVWADIFLRSNREYTDLYLCLCDVTPASKSTNVCDGYIRLRPQQPSQPRGDSPATRKVRVEFWPTAYRFPRAHRLRVIVAGGAHPRYARNPGTADPLGDAQTMLVAHQEILHGPEHPSAITLSVG